MKFQNLYEAPPRLVLPTEFGLDDPIKNKNLANKLLTSKQSKKIKSLGNNIDLYEFPRQYALIDGSIPTIVYYVRFAITNYSFTGQQCITQLQVWRNDFYAESQGFAKYMFFDILLPKHGCILTSHLHTDPDGRRFWTNRINDAFNMSLNVYYISFIQPRIIKRIHSMNDLRNIKNQTWGYGKKYEARRILISNHELQEK